MKILIRNTTPVNAAGLAALIRLEAPDSNIFIAQSHKDAVDILAQHDIDACIATPYLLSNSEHPTQLLPDVTAGNHTKVVGVQAITKSILKDAEEAGYDGVIDLNISVGRYMSEINAIKTGQKTLNEQIVAFEKSHHPSIPFSLRDEMDRQIVSLIGLGYSDQQIANTVFLSCQSVRNRISRILRDSKLQNRTQLAVSYLCEHMGVVLGTAAA